MHSCAVGKRCQLLKANNSSDSDLQTDKPIFSDLADAFLDFILQVFECLQLHLEDI